MTSQRIQGLLQSGNPVQHLTPTSVQESYKARKRATCSVESAAMNPHDPRLKIKRWRWHAQQCRSDAESMNADARSAMLRIADSYEQMANLAEAKLLKGLGKQRAS